MVLGNYFVFLLILGFGLDAVEFYGDLVDEFGNYVGIFCHFAEIREVGWEKIPPDGSKFGAGDEEVNCSPG